jgi:ABC-type molybdate transport system substrate-binding protein
MKRYYCLILLPILFLTAYASVVTTIPTTLSDAAAPTTSPTYTPKLRTLTVFASPSLTNVLRKIGVKLESTHPDITATNNFAASQDLCTQIEQGTSADIYASTISTKTTALVNSRSLKSFLYSPKDDLAAEVTAYVLDSKVQTILHLLGFSLLQYHR